MKNIQYDPITRFEQRRAILISDSPQRRDEIGAMAQICNCAILSVDLTPSTRVQPPAVDILLADLPSIMEGQGQTLSNIARYLDDHNSHALIWTDMDCLEEAYAMLPHDKCHFLVNSSDVDAIPYLAGAITLGNMNRLHDNSHDGKFGALHKISDELANFAQLLTRIADQEDHNNHGVSDKLTSFKPAAANIFMPFTSTEITMPPAAAAPPINAVTIREIIKLRRMRDNHFPAELFADPAWDILLDLLAARLEGGAVSVSSLCIAASVPPTTALRWITSMTQDGMLVRRSDPQDARRVFIDLSPDTADRLINFFSAAKNRLMLIL